MTKYLKQFELTTQYEEYINSDVALLPNVSVTNDDNKVHYNPISTNYLTFTAEQDNSTIALNSVTNPDIKYRLNEGAWVQWDYSAITLNTGDIVRMKGNNSNGFSTSSSKYNQFQMTGKISASGNIMSLLYENDFERRLTIPCEHCFYGMFKDCTSLTTAPKLPATSLNSNCYANMFRGCTSLTAAPELPATTLASYCYYSMFFGCTGMTTAPDLPATTLDNYCYANMFRGCTNLKTAPNLSATRLVNGCYAGMFYGCTKLNYIKMLATNINSTNCLSTWVKDVASTGTFIKRPNMVLPTGTSGIPSGWTVQNAA